MLRLEDVVLADFKYGSNQYLIEVVMAITVLWSCHSERCSNAIRPTSMFTGLHTCIQHHERIHSASYFVLFPPYFRINDLNYIIICSPCLILCSHSCGRNYIYINTLKTVAYLVFGQLHPFLFAPYLKRWCSHVLRFLYRCSFGAHKKSEGLWIFSECTTYMHVVMWTLHWWL